MNLLADSIIISQKRFFTVLMAIAVALFVIDVVFHRFFPPVELQASVLRICGYFTFIISIIAGIGAPIMLRTSYQKKAAAQGEASAETYLKLQQRLSLAVFISAVSADIAYFFPVQTLYLYGAFLSAIYGIYSIIPYRKRITGELKFYKLID